MTLNDQTGDIASHYVGPGKLCLPNIANSSSMKHGLIDIEKAVASFVQISTPTPRPCTAPIPTPLDHVEIKIKVLERTSRCNCGGRKMGFTDAQVAGHYDWCDVFKKDEA
jgi:hypothetical protein